MPTARSRHFVTETDEVAEALDRAAERWPGLSRSQLLVRLVMEADRAAQERLEARRQRRREAIAELSGSLTGVYEPGYLDTLRQDWPE
jgi:histidinol-phosphate/aromatic aminotransferase/cobyric acid decarboxylase-like protein